MCTWVLWCLTSHSAAVAAALECSLTMDVTVALLDTGTRSSRIGKGTNSIFRRCSWCPHTKTFRTCTNSICRTLYFANNANFSYSTVNILQNQPYCSYIWYMFCQMLLTCLWFISQNIESKFHTKFHSPAPESHYTCRWQLAPSKLQCICGVKFIS